MREKLTLATPNLQNGRNSGKLHADIALLCKAYKVCPSECNSYLDFWDFNTEPAQIFIHLWLFNTHLIKGLTSNSEFVRGYDSAQKILLICAKPTYPSFTGFLRRILGLGEETSVGAPVLVPWGCV